MPKNPHANFTPSLEGYSGQGAFRFWCQTALPLTYDDSLSYYELLAKVVNYLNNTIEDVSAIETNVGRLAEAYNQLQDYVNKYFDDLDIEAELKSVLDAMAEDGTLDALLEPLISEHLPAVVADQIGGIVADQIDDVVAEQIDDVVDEHLPDALSESIPDVVTDWLDDNVDPVGSAVIVDNTLSISGAAADAKITGDKINTNTKVLNGSSLIRLAEENDLMNGGVNYQSGVITIPVDTSVMTKMIPVENFCSVYKHDTFRLKIVAYSSDTENSYIGGISVPPNTVNGYQPYTQEDLLNRYPTAKYVIIEFRGWNGSSWTDPQSVSGILALDPQLKFYNLPDIIKKVDNSVVVDDTLSISGEAADAKVTGERILNIENEISRKATENDLLNGNVNYLNGSITIPSDSSVMTNMIPVDVFCSVYKNTNYRLKIIAYANENPDSYIDGISVAPNTVDGYQPYTRMDLIERFPTAKYVIIEFRVWEDGQWADPQSPEGVLAVNPDLRFYTFLEVESLTSKVNNYYNQFFEINGDYTTDLTFTVRMGSEKYKNMLVDSYASYEGDEAPTIHFSRRWEGSDGVYRAYQGSAYYRLGDKNNYKRQTFRFPPHIKGAEEVVTFLITIPQGTTLHLKNLTNYYDNMVSREGNGIKISAHSFNGYGGPINTSPSFEMAGKLGYGYCITIPKVTSDGVYVCLHDDNGIQNTARNPDGTQIASEYQNKPIREFTYSELLQFDFGIVRGKPFAGTKIPLLEDFFKICAKTGMHPVLSIHPSLSGHWVNIKNLAKKYGVLNKLNIKAAINIIETPMSVLLDEIESYTLDVNDNDIHDRTQNVLNLISLYNIDTNKCHMAIEYMYVPEDTWISNALNNDIAVGYATVSADLTNLYTLMEKGVTEFTCNNHCCVGLSW